MIIVVSKVKAIAKENNKRVSREYLELLSRKVEQLVQASIARAPRVTLTAEDVYTDGKII